LGIVDGSEIQPPTWDVIETHRNHTFPSFLGLISPIFLGLAKPSCFKGLGVLSGTM